MIAGIMEIVAEAHVFAEKTEVGSTVLEQLIEQNFGALAYSDSLRMTQGVYCPAKGSFSSVHLVLESPQQTMAEWIQSSDQNPYSDLDLAIKDVGHGLACAESVGMHLGVASLVVDNLKEAKKYSLDHGGRRLDSSSIFGAVRTQAGLDFQTDLVRKRDEEF